MKKTIRPTVLVILDGFGHAPASDFNAVTQAKIPNINSWLKTYPHTLLAASGIAVGLPEGTMGNSEVGHLTLGCGTIINQPLTIIHRAVRDGSLATNKTLVNNLAKLKQNNGRLHLMGLLSDAGVHSNFEHVVAYLEAAKQAGIHNVFIHAFLDGRDTPPQSASTYLQTLDATIQKLGIGTLATIQGRFYAMDRDNNWERTAQCYATLTQPQTTEFHDWHSALHYNYDHGKTDEFVAPVQLNNKGTIKNGDGVLFFNFRPDRARQLTAAFIDPQFQHFSVTPLHLSFFITPVQYAPTFHNEVLFSREPIAITLPDVLHAHAKRMFAIAETEKYAHVTYFFSGGREQAYATETRVLIPSIPAKNYIDLPEMSAREITQAVLQSLLTDPHDFYLINYANPDMVGHSGNLAATVKALECLDGELKKLYDIIVTQMDGTLYITSDHGNAEKKRDENGQPHTAHTTNKVPFLMIQKAKKGSSHELPLTQLADVAPFILQTMGLPVPTQMLRVPTPNP